MYSQSYGMNIRAYDFSSFTLTVIAVADEDDGAGDGDGNDYDAFDGSNASNVDSWFLH